MVACRVTDARNGGGVPGSSSQVPLKKYDKSRVSSMSALAAVLNWIWPKDRCNSSATPRQERKSLGHIHRSADGRFVLADSLHSSRANSVLNSSSSDDGGFLPRRTRGRASWRRPLVTYPSQLSLRSEGSGRSAHAVFPGLLGALIGLNRSSMIPSIYSPYTPRFQASSPAASSPAVTTLWSPIYFSDLSSVRQASSGDRSFPTPPSFLQLRSVHQRYSQELPPLRAIHEETQRVGGQGFIPVHPLATSSPPRMRAPPPPPQSIFQSNRPRARLLPRHARIARSAPELALSTDHLVIHEASPESRSSSSGFGSKNTSQQNQSSRSGSTCAEWRLPPYRPPPPPPSHVLPPPPPLIVGPWLELAARLHVASEHKAVDVGSVDGHYEFDPATPTPTPSTPTSPRDDPDTLIGTLRRDHKTVSRMSRYDNIEARVQAMKEEFHAFRKRQAMRRTSSELESAC